MFKSFISALLIANGAIADNYFTRDNLNLVAAKSDNMLKKLNLSSDVNASDLPEDA